MEPWQQQELDALLAEYLADQGFNSTLKLFKEECQKRGRELSLPADNAWSEKQDRKLNIQSDLLISFECGEREAFFDIWREVIPQSIRNNDPTTQHLEFSIAVYFALYPFRYEIGDTQPAMRYFQTYLNSKGDYITLSPDLAIYCALPYIPDPASHASFKHLFTESWNKELRSRLEQFLEVSIVGVASNQSRPTLIDLYKQGHDFSTLSPHRSQSSSESTLLKERLEEMQSSYHTLAHIAIELVEALESAVSGVSLNPDDIQDMCSRLFQASVAPPFAPPSINQDERPVSALQASVMSLRQSVQGPLSQGGKKFTSLDYPRLKRDLSLLPGSSKRAILQALRWRLTHSMPGSQRDSVLLEYILNDLLSLNKQTDTSATLLFSSDDSVREHYCRLINSVTSMRGGRNYIQSSKHLVHSLCTTLMSLNDEDPILRNVLGAVQKLSLRRPLQSHMISIGLIKWNVQLLNNLESLSDYTLRYCLALLMNLCLRQEGKHACIQLLPQSLNVLGDLLEHDNTEVRSYINGILYSLFDVKELRQAAAEMDMIEMLQSAMKGSTPELQSQLQFIINKLHSNIDVPAPDDEESEDNEEDDPEFIDGDEEEESSGICGEDLLKTYYTDVPNHADQTISSVPFMRPVTPQAKGGHIPSVRNSLRPSSAHGRVDGPLTKSVTMDRPKTSYN